MSAQTPTSPSLLLRIRDHDDREAWQYFCDIYGPLIYGYCRKRNLDANDSADVAQEVLIRVASGIREFKYDRSKGRFRDWLSRIVHNEISRWFTKRIRNNTKSLNNNDQDSHANQTLWSEHFQQYILDTALKTTRPHFSAVTWQAFRMVWIENCSCPEVAKKLNRSLGFVYTSKSRVLKRLRLEFEQLSEDAIC